MLIVLKSAVSKTLYSYNGMQDNVELIIIR